MNHKQNQHIKIKRAIAWGLMVLGSLIIFATIIWLIAYHIEAYSSNNSYHFGDNLLWWLPLSLLLFPGLLMLVHGIKIHKSEPLAPIAILELLIVFATLGIIAAIAIRPDNPSYIERAKKHQEQQHLNKIKGQIRGSLPIN